MRKNTDYFASFYNNDQDDDGLKELVYFFLKTNKVWPYGDLENFRDQLLKQRTDEEEKFCIRLGFSVAGFILNLNSAWTEARQMDYLQNDTGSAVDDLHILRHLDIKYVENMIILELDRPDNGNILAGLPAGTMQIFLRVGRDGTVRSTHLGTTFN